MLTIIIDLLSPLSHGAFDAGDIGNATPIRRLPIVSLPGRPEVPVLSGGALRGRMRRIVMRHLFDACDLSHATLPGREWDRLYAALANGGHLDGSEQTANPATRRALRAALPPLSLFGASLYTYMIAGRVSVGIAWPACQETVDAGLVPMPAGLPLLPAEDLVAETSSTRHIDRDEHDPAVSGVTPMPVTIETLGTGTQLVSLVRYAPEATDVERAIIPWAIERLDSLGAKSGAGLGSVHVRCEGGSPDAYSDWLRDQRDAAREALVELAGAAGAVSKKKEKKGRALAPEEAT